MGALRWLKVLYIQVLIGIALGVLVGALWPETGAALKPLGDAFIKLIKLTIAPVIFCTVAAGIAHMSDLKKFGRVGGKALLDFGLTPVSRVIPAGGRLRVTITGADPRQRNLQDIKQTPAPVLTLFRGGRTGSRIDLPVTP